MIKKIPLLLITLPLTLSYGEKQDNKLTNKPITACKSSKSISGNPIHSSSDYTINGEKSEFTDFTCHFINTGKTAAQINIWTTPNAITPHQTIELQAASSATKPTQSISKLHLRMYDKWWCGIYAPQSNSKKTAYCAYINIASNDISNIHPFAIWQKRKNEDNKISYTCRITPSQQPAQFHWFSAT